jgi:hypothetical protein
MEYSCEWDMFVEIIQFRTCCNYLIRHHNMAISLRRKGFTSLASIHVPHFDVMTITYGFVAHIESSKLPMFLIEQHDLARGASFGHDWANNFGHFQMAMLGSFTC